MIQARSGQSGVSEEQSRGGGFVVSIVSGKGGVGKTNLALNLGIHLARRVRRVILADADFGLANADILLNVMPLASFADVLDPARPIGELLIDAPGGLRVLCGTSGAGQRAAGREISPVDCARAIQRLRAAADLLITDCGAGLSPTVVACALASDLLIVATTPEPTALADGYATLKQLANQGLLARVGVVVNMARSRVEADSVARRLAAAARRFLGLSVEDLGCVLLDRHVPQAVRARVPVSIRHPTCPASSCIERISARIVPSARARPVLPGVWSRVAGLFL